MYEITRDGFRIYSNTKEGKKPDNKDVQYAYWRHLYFFPGDAILLKNSIFEHNKVFR